MRPGRRTTLLAASLALALLPALPFRALHLEPATPAASTTPEWLARLNAWRASAGQSALTENTLWDQGDYNHSLYMVKNDQVTHYEISTLPYYTAAGDTAARNGNIEVNSTTAFTDDQAIDWWMAAPFHAMGMMDPRLTSTGFGSYREVKSGWQAGFTLDTLRGNSFTGGSYPVFFPGNGANVPLSSYSGNEFPDPLQACPGYSAPTGLPAFVEVGGNVATTVTAHSFTANGIAMPNCVIDSNSPSVGSNLTSRGGVIVIPQQPLVPGVKYVVSLVVNGVGYTWSFGVTSNGSATPGCSGFPVIGDFSGSGKADVVALGGASACVMVSSGTGLAAPTPWSSLPFYGNLSTLAGDVTGDGKADLVAVSRDQTFVMTSTGTSFGPPAGWSGQPFYGTRGTFLADVNGDGKADLVAVNDTSVWVMLSTGSSFGPPTLWSNTPFYGNVTTLVGDVNGDGKADLIALNNGSTWVMTSTGAGFNAPAEWSNLPFYGSVTTIVSDVTGDGKADLVAVDGTSTWVMSSTGSGFNSPAVWLNVPFYGQWATLAGDVNGDKKGDLVAINYSSVWVVASTGTSFSAPSMWFA